MKTKHTSDSTSLKSSQDSRLPGEMDKLLDVMAPMIKAGMVHQEIAILLMMEAWQSGTAVEYTRLLLERNPQTQREVWDMLQDIIPQELAIPPEEMAAERS